MAADPDLTVPFKRSSNRNSFCATGILCYRQQERHPYEPVRRSGDTAVKGREVRFKMVVVKEMFPLYTPTLRGASPCLPSHPITRERRDPPESRPGDTQQAHKTVHRSFPRRACVFVGRTVGGLSPNTFVITGTADPPGEKHIGKRT